MTNFEELLDRYADLIVSWGVNIQPGQLFYINAEPIHRHFCGKLAKRAYEKGAKFVHISLNAPEFLKIRLENTAQEGDLDFVPLWFPARYKEMIDEEAASLRIIGSEDPEMLQHIDPKRVNRHQLGIRKAIKQYYEEGVGKHKITWTLAAHATPAWGKNIFPEYEADEACRLLWQEIFKICRVDREDYLDAWEKHNSTLHRRATTLDNLNIQKLHFKGPGTDLSVFLSPKATFQGGSSLSAKRQVPFEPNLPTEECFTTPDYRYTEGYVNVTRPVLVNGKLIQGLELEFKQGELARFSAKEGEKTFHEYIHSDPGAKRLGEVALVGCDSPIYQTGRVFREILYDENAACHIAIGSAYTFCIKGGPSMAREELNSLGVNQSACHLDMMISNEKVDVYAETFDNQTIQLIKKGAWVI